jgi:hypothetical protein
VPERRLGTFMKTIMRRDHSVGKMVFMDSVGYSFSLFSATHGRGAVGEELTTDFGHG